VALTMITALVILAVTSNVVLSLGMVGALSIVRFRTAIKEPLDIAFLFWSIAVGIVLAAGFIPLAVVGSVVIGVILLVFANTKSHANPYIVVLSCSDKAGEDRAMKLLGENTKRCVCKSKTVRKGLIELNLEIPPQGRQHRLRQQPRRAGGRGERRACQLQRRLHGIRRGQHVNAQAHRPDLRCHHPVLPAADGPVHERQGAGTQRLRPLHGL
jgi:hypothetical protein